jgi:hypothetical protein
MRGIQFTTLHKAITLKKQSGNVYTDRGTKPPS